MESVETEEYQLVGYKPPKLRGWKRLRYGMLVKNVLHEIAVHWPHHQSRAFWYRLRGTRIGRDVGIGRGVFMEEARPDLITIEDGVHLGPNVMILTHDSHPKCTGEGETRYGPVTLKKRCFIGAGSIILPGVTVGERAVVAAGSIVHRNVPDGGKWIQKKALEEIKYETQIRDCRQIQRSVSHPRHSL